MFHHAKKSMGQNFLKSQPALNMMCSISDVNDKDIILEIGPGKGALTEKLLEKAGKVIAIEKDRELIEILKDKFAEEIKTGKLELIEKDILEFEIGIHPAFQAPLGEGNYYKIIANIPYNITGAILKKFLSEITQPKSMTLLVQKEVAERIVARDGKESILSLSVKAYGTPKYIMRVGKRFFSPAPKVDSAIIYISDISKKNFKKENDEDKFFQIVKAGFAHKRKVLRKNLESLGVKGEEIDKIFEKLKINSKSRAEDIPIEKWFEISNYLA